MRDFKTLLLLVAAAVANVATAHHCPATIEATGHDVEGPFFTPGTPERNFLVPVERSPGEERVFVHGHVTDLDCVHLKCAEIEVWGASKDGEYDAESETFWGRGRLKVDETGTYNYTTVIPGRYRLGSSFRPTHIHMKVIVPGVPTLTTQLYFEDDPFLGRNDPCGTTCNSGDETLIMPKTYINGEWNVNFDIHMNTHAAWLPESCRAITDDGEETVMNGEAVAQEVYDEDTVVDGKQDIKEDKSWFDAKNSAVCYRKCLTDEHPLVIIPGTPKGEKNLKLYCKVACGRGEFSVDNDKISMLIKKMAWMPFMEPLSIEEATNGLLESYNDLKQEETSRWTVFDMSWLEAKNSAVCYRKCVKNGEHPWLIIPHTPTGLQNLWKYCKLACGSIIAGDDRQTEAGFVKIKGRKLSGDDLSRSIKDEARRGASQNGGEPEPVSINKATNYLLDMGDVLMMNGEAVAQEDVDDEDTAVIKEDMSWLWEEEDTSWLWEEKSWLEAKNSGMCYRMCLTSEHPWLIIPSTPEGQKDLNIYCKLACGGIIAVDDRQTEAGFVKIKGREFSGWYLPILKDKARDLGEGKSTLFQEPISINKATNFLLDFPTTGNGR